LGTLKLTRVLLPRSAVPSSESPTSPVGLSFRVCVRS